jgi:broad specificity phosphatase PhoE
VSVEIIFEYHSTSVDNEAGVASGWRDPPLSEKGREEAQELGERRQAERFDAVFCSDLRRAVETAEIAFGAVAPVRRDRRLREYDYGTMTGAPADVVRAERQARLDVPFPGGESLPDVVDRVRGFLDYLARRLDGKRVVVIGHGATRLALEHLLAGVSLEEAAAEPFKWEPGYRYVLHQTGPSAPGSLEG